MLPLILIGYAAHMKETYENPKQIVQCINYKQYCWQLCGDLKVIDILLGLQPGYAKYCCFCVNEIVPQGMKIILKRSGQKEAL